MYIYYENVIMPEIKLPKNNDNIEEESFTDNKKETKPKKQNGIVSAYDENGNPRKENQDKLKLSKGFKVFVIIIYILGFFAALGVIFLMHQCSK